MQVITLTIPDNIFSKALAALNHCFSVSGVSHYVDFYSLGWVLFFFTLMTYILSKEQWLVLRRELQQMAMNDQLTHLPNRRLFEDRANQLLQVCRRKEKGFAILLADLDDFKLINDSMGHQAGDMVLKELACRFLTVIRAEDTVARLGGDEFAFLLQDVCCEEDLEIVLQRIYAVLDEPIAIEERTFNIGMSIGVVFFPYHCADVDGLLRRADISLYRAKEERNTYQIYSDEDDELLGLPSMAKHNDLRKAG